MKKNYRNLMKNSLAFILAVLCCTSCNTIEARKPVSQRTGTVLSHAIKQTKELITAENAFIESFIAKDSTAVYTTAPFGFWYAYNNKIEAEIAFPVEGDVVTFEYSISDIFDTEIYSKTELGIKEYTIDREDFIPALQEGLKLMKVGETVTFIIPSHRAFGLVGDGHKIAMNTTLKSKVTLLNITQK